VRTTPLQPHLVDHALAYARGERTRVEPADAATVILTRDSSAGLEVYLLRRHSEMAFASGMYVVPGGRVDPRDGDVDIAWSGPSAADWSGVLGCDPSLARALVCAAVRETFEESGVLLAGRTPQTVVESTTEPDWEADRLALVARDISLAEFLARRELILRSDLLNPWAHWITPEFEPRRYDTRFFVTTISATQHPRDVSGEADQVVWITAAEACVRVDRGQMKMLPPTYRVCEELADLATTDAVMATHPRLYPIQPRLAFVGDEAVLTIEVPGPPEGGTSS
jgi:8-oxo-dGTP pyrophosphatase MutT (NUDIX family)